MVGFANVSGKLNVKTLTPQKIKTARAREIEREQEGKTREKTAGLALLVGELSIKSPGAVDGGRA